jgi:hypothetical protein
MDQRELGAAPAAPRDDAPAEWAAEWHRVVEIMCTVLGIDGNGSSKEVLEAFAAWRDRPSPDERAAFVGWITSTYPRVYSEEEAERYWRFEHISALAWQARAVRSARPAAPLPEPVADSAVDKAWDRFQDALAAGQVDDMATLIRRLARALQKAAPEHDLPAKALDYLKRKRLDASPLRAAAPLPGELPDEREAFETWAISTGLAYRDEHGHGVCFYAADHREPSWQGWNARAALSAHQPEAKHD